MILAINKLTNTEITFSNLKLYEIAKSFNKDLELVSNEENKEIVIKEFKTSNYSEKDFFEKIESFSKEQLNAFTLDNRTIISKSAKKYLRTLEKENSI